MKLVTKLIKPRPNITGRYRGVSREQVYDKADGRWKFNNSGMYKCINMSDEIYERVLLVRNSFIKVLEKQELEN